MSLMLRLESAIRADAKQARRNAHVAICESKMKFTSKADAKRYCKMIVRKHGDPRVHPYECPVCGKFHLTKNRDHSHRNSSVTLSL